MFPVHTKSTRNSTPSDSVDRCWTRQRDHYYRPRWSNVLIRLEIGLDRPVMVAALAWPALGAFVGMSKPGCG